MIIFRGKLHTVGNGVMLLQDHGRKEIHHDRPTATIVRDGDAEWLEWLLDGYDGCEVVIVVNDHEDR